SPPRAPPGAPGQRAASRRPPLPAQRRGRADAVQVEVDDARRDRLRPVLGRVLEDGSAREPEQEGGRQVAAPVAADPGAARRAPARRSRLASRATRWRWSLVGK